VTLSNFGIWMLGGRRALAFVVTLQFISILLFSNF
jgi:hypothetical protein